MGIDLIRSVFVVGMGSFIGGAARFLLSVAMKSVGGGFPWATLAVNLLGCLAIGAVYGFYSRAANGGGDAALFLAYGVCGGFTTFSTFSKETLMMLQCGNYLGAVCYVCISVFAGITLTACGYLLAR